MNVYSPTVPKPKNRIFIPLIVAVVTLVFAVTANYLPLSTKSTCTTPTVKYAMLPAGSSSIDSVANNAKNEALFEALLLETVTAHSDFDHWFRVDVSEHTTKKDREWFLRIDFTGIDTARAYSFNANGDSFEYVFGDDVAHKRWPMQTRLPTIPLGTGNALAKTIYINPENTGQPVVLPIRIISNKELQQEELLDTLWYGVFFGASYALALYTLFLGLSTKLTVYLSFALYLIPFLTLQLSISGIGQQYLWPSLESFTTVFALAMMAFTSAGMTLFVDHILELKSTSPTAHRVLRVFLFLSLVPVPLLAIFQYIPIQVALHVLSLVVMVLVTVITLRQLRQGSRAAIYLSIGYGVLFVAIVATLLRYYGIGNSNFLTEHLLEGAILFEAFVLCLGLADKISEIKDKQRASERLARDAEIDFTRQLITTTERERRRFGSIIHDDIGQDVAVLRLALTQDLSKVDGLDAAAISRTHEGLGNVLDKLRELAYDSHLHLIGQVGLHRAIDAMLSRSLDRLGIDYLLDFDGSEPKIDTAEQLYRIVQECITNTIKHAEASHVHIVLVTQNGMTRLSFSDNGEGAELSNDSPETGFGLRSIKQRTDFLNGEWRVWSDDTGFHIVVTVPATDD